MLKKTKLIGFICLFCGLFSQNGIAASAGIPNFDGTWDGIQYLDIEDVLQISLSIESDFFRMKMDWESASQYSPGKCFRPFPYYWHEYVKGKINYTDSSITFDGNYTNSKYVINTFFDSCSSLIDSTRVGSFQRNWVYFSNNDSLWLVWGWNGMENMKLVRTTTEIKDLKNKKLSSTSNLFQSKVQASTLFIHLNAQEMDLKTDLCDIMGRNNFERTISGNQILYKNLKPGAYVLSVKQIGGIKAREKILIPR